MGPFKTVWVENGGVTEQLFIFMALYSPFSIP